MCYATYQNPRLNDASRAETNDLLITISKL